MPAITISRCLGSLGTQIARDLAETLGYRLVGREVINEAAYRASAPEVALAVIDELGLFGLRPSSKARRAYLSSIQQIMMELVAEGEVVILGRAGQAILRDRSDVLHIRVTAPQNLRVLRLMMRQQVSEAAAGAQIRKSDTTRRTYLKHNYDIVWDDPEHYDLVINTEHITVPMASALIQHAWHDQMMSITP